MHRRKWLKQSLLASSIPLIGGSVALSDLYPDWQESVRIRAEGKDNILRLNWNENPYGPSGKTKKTMKEALDRSHRYPDALVNLLKEELAERHGLVSNQIMLTAGSTEVLSLLGQHVALDRGEILVPWPSFPTMILFGERCGASIRKVELSSDQIDLNQLQDGIDQNTKLIFICNPNNPTSTEVDHVDLMSFCKQVPEGILVCIDEAYIEYSQLGTKGSVVSLIDELPNLVICRTFSKAYGLAGLRIGYALSNAVNIDALRKRHTGWELSAGVVPVIAARSALKDQSHLKYCVSQNQAGRSILYSALESWEAGHSRSSTNFVYIRSKRFDPDVVTKLREEKVLITKWPDMHDHIRVSIGTPEQMQQFVEVAQKYVL